MQTAIQRFICMAACALSCALFSTSATAEEDGTDDKFEYSGTEMLQIINGELQISDNIGFRGHIAYFVIPSKDVHQVFVYAGPTFSFKSDSGSTSVWISPQAVLAPMWQQTDTGTNEAIGPSLWVALSLLNGKLSMFGEVDLYFIGKKPDVFGQTSIDYNHSEKWSIGGHTENVGLNFIAGPHIGMKIGRLRLRLDWNVRMDGWGHSMRTVAILPF